MCLLKSTWKLLKSLVVHQISWCRSQISWCRSVTTKPAPLQVRQFGWESSGSNLEHKLSSLWKWCEADGAERQSLLWRLFLRCCPFVTSYLMLVWEMLLMSNSSNWLGRSSFTKSLWSSLLPVLSHQSRVLLDQRAAIPENGCTKGADQGFSDEKRIYLGWRDVVSSKW